MKENLKNLLFNRYIVVVAYNVAIAIGFFLMLQIVKYVSRLNLPERSLTVQINTGFVIFIRGVILHYFVFLSGAFLGWQYTRKNPERSFYRNEISIGLFYSTLLMFLLGFIYLIVFMNKF